MISMILYYPETFGIIDPNFSLTFNFSLKYYSTGHLTNVGFQVSQRENKKKKRGQNKYEILSTFIKYQYTYI